MTARSILAVHQSTVQKNSILKQFSRPPPIFCLIYRPNKLLTPLTAYKAFITMQNDAKKGVEGWSGYQGWTPRPAGRGGVPLFPTLWGGGSLPGPSPLNDQNQGKLRGKIKVRLSIFFFQKRKPMMEQYYSTERCQIQSVNGVFKRHHPLQCNAMHP